MKKYAMYIGRWQNFHDGHKWLIDQQLKKGKNIWLAIRNVQKDSNNPKTGGEVLMELSKDPYILENDIYVSLIPDIESVNYGRGVGYEVIEHFPPEDIKEISGTKIRESLN